LLVQYVDAGAASAAVDTLRSSSIAGLVAAEADLNLLAAVFGSIPESEARALLSDALAPD
jgi:hypothetical protein